MTISVVQSKTGTQPAGSSLTITLSSPTTAGNCLIVCIAASATVSNPTVGGVTLGGSADHFVSDTGNIGTATYDGGAIWSDPNCAGGQTAVAITLTGGSGTLSIDAAVFEVSGLLTASPFDKTQNNAGVSTPANSWSSGATATLSQATEIAIGFDIGAQTSLVINGPTSPWTNLAAVGTNSYGQMVAGYNIVSSTTGLAYAGTYTGATSGSTAIIATYKGVVSPPFPVSPLGLKTELLLNNTWTDISQYVQHDAQDSEEHPAAVSITRGRQDETATSPTPQQATLKVWNGDGRFCSKNPVGAYYPYLTRNTPLRVSYPGTTGTVATFMQIASDATGAATAADVAALDITGQIDIRVDLTPQAFPMAYGDYGSFSVYPTVGATLAAKWAETSAQRSWAFLLEPTGQVSWHWYDGSASRVLYSGPSLVVPLGQRIALRVVFTPSTGVAQFYTAANMGGSFTLISTQTFGATTLAAGTGTPVTIGAAPVWAPLVAQVYEAKILNPSAVVVADPVFSSQTAGATSFADAQSNTWALSGVAQIVSTGSSTRNYRFYGQISSLPVTWDPTGNDVWASITASGPLRRLQQGNQPNAYSTMRRYAQSLPAPYTPQAFWPCEDAQGSTTIASGLPGGFPMNISGSPNLSSDTAFACSNPLPVVNSASMTGSVASYTATGQVGIKFLLTVPASPATPNGAVLLRAMITGGTCTYVQIVYLTGGSLGFQGFNASGAVFDTGAVAFGLNGRSVLVSAEMGTINGVVQEAIRTMAPGALDANFNATTVITPGAVTQVIVDPTANVSDISIGQIIIQSAVQGMEAFTYPLNAWLGEPAGVRFARLCQENNIPCRVDGTWGRTVPMGYQVPDTLMNLLQACEDTDRGQIYEPRDFTGVAYRTLDSLTSQQVALTLDYNQDHMAPPLAPTDDDLYVVNDVTVTNASSSSSFSGSSSQKQLNDGSAMSISVIGDYANSYNVSTASDQQLSDEAGWILHTGTGNDERYPSVVVNLAVTQPQVQAIAATVESLDIGAYAQIVNTPSFLPPGPVNLLVWGYDEYLGDFCNEITFNTIPESVYEVGISDDVVRGHADTDGSTLSTGVSSTATSWSVATTKAGSPLWTTVAGNFPFDWIIDGERVTVTNITGASSPQTATVVRSVNGILKAHLAGAAITLYQPAYAGLTA